MLYLFRQDDDGALHIPLVTVLFGKDDVNSQFTFTYDDIKGTVHVVDHLTGEEYDLLKEDTGWFDAEFKFDV